MRLLLVTLATLVTLGSNVSYADVLEKESIPVKECMKAIEHGKKIHNIQDVLGTDTWITGIYAYKGFMYEFEFHYDQVGRIHPLQHCFKYVSTVY